MPMSSGQNASAMTAEPPALPEPYFASGDGRFRLYQGDCLALLPRMPEAAFDLIFADPPYFLSNGGITCHAGKMVSVHTGQARGTNPAQKVISMHTLHRSILLRMASNIFSARILYPPSLENCDASPPLAQ